MKRIMLALFVLLAPLSFCSGNIAQSSADSVHQEDRTQTSNYVIVNGHEFVDLGLPSGLKWATCNVGADSPGEDGYYFAWGETEPKSYYSEDTYKWYNGNSYTKYTRIGKTTLDAADDAAAQNWGKGCRMPTQEDFEELLKYTTQEWTTMYGVEGMKFTSKMNDAFVFFPASAYRGCNSRFGHGECGYYWCASLFPYMDYRAYILKFNSFGCGFLNEYRNYGLSVRAVCPKSK